MSRIDLLRLVAGFRRFRSKYFAGATNRFSGGQTPRTLVIGCSDSRVDPAILTSASPGEIFVVRNVANLVPPYEQGGGLHGTSAAIEFAVANLKVETVLVLGHRQCGGIRALMGGFPLPEESFIGPWVSVVKSARDVVLAKYPDETMDQQCRHCEMEAIKVSMKNLETFPFVKAAKEERKLDILGVYFDLESGSLFEYEAATDEFKELPMD